MLDWLPLCAVYLLVCAASMHPQWLIHLLQMIHPTAREFASTQMFIFFLSTCYYPWAVSYCHTLVMVSVTMSFRLITCFIKQCDSGNLVIDKVCSCMKPPHLYKGKCPVSFPHMEKKHFFSWRFRDHPPYDFLTAPLRPLVSVLKHHFAGFLGLCLSVQISPDAFSWLSMTPHLH